VKRFVALVLLALALSSCTLRFDMGLVVNEDESGTFSAFIGMDEELRSLIESGGEGSFTDEMMTDVPDGFTVEEYSDGGYDGVRIVADFTSIDDLNAKLAAANSDNDGSGPDMVNNIVLTHEGDEFRFSVDTSDMSSSLSDQMGSAGGEDMMMDSSMMADLFDIRFRLTLPGSITEHNADQVDGSTLTWEIGLDDTRTSLEAVSTTSGSSSALLIGGVAVVAAALIGGGVAMSRRKKQSAVDAVANTPTEPIDPIS